MKALVKTTKEVEIKTLQVKAPVQYTEDATVNGIKDENGDLMPCMKNNEMWEPEIDIDTGIIRNWRQGVKADIHYKVCDSGSYYLLDAEGNTVLSIEENYVPKIMCPKERGYGDYIIIEVDEDGKISGWKANIEDFFENEED